MKNTSNKLESLGLSAVRIIFLFTGRRGLSNLVEIFLPYLLSRKRGFAGFFVCLGICLMTHRCTCRVYYLSLTDPLKFSVPI